MKSAAERKEETRRRIVDAAARLFRERGVESAALPEIMRAAGLTVGGFYRHFESKEELFEAALEASLRQTLAMLRSRRGGGGEEWIEKAAAVYLDPAHRDNVAHGCPLPILTPEVARRRGPVRASCGRVLEEIVDEITAKMPAAGPPEARERAWAFLATLVGGLLLSRGVDDGEVADEILRACRRAVTRP